MKMKIKNLTPHSVTILGGDSPLAIPSEGIARVGQTREQVGTIAGVPVYRSTYGAVTGLPEQRDGIALLVSALVRMACPGRADLYSPGELARDAAGQPVGCRGLEGAV
jgi:hypothetical protein